MENARKPKLILTTLFATLIILSCSVAVQGIRWTSPQFTINNNTLNVNGSVNAQYLQGLTPAQVAALFTSEWLYNQTTPFSNWLSSFAYNYNQTYTGGTYNATYAIWAYNQTVSSSSGWVADNLTENRNYSTTGVVTTSAIYNRFILTSSQYPPVQNITYVNASLTYSANYLAPYATDPTKSLIGSRVLNSWMSGTVTNQTFHIDLGQAKAITQIYYENAHSSGTDTNAGAKIFTLWGSNSESSFLNYSYNNNSGWTQLTTSVSQMTEHVATNTADPQYIGVTNTNSYRYYRFKFENNWGHASFLGVRRLELQMNLTTGKMTVDIENKKLYDSQNSSVLEWGTGNIVLPNNNQKIYFGNGRNASIYYSGANLYINPNESGLAELYLGNTVNIPYGNLKVLNGQITGYGSAPFFSRNALGSGGQLSGLSVGLDNNVASTGTGPSFLFFADDSSGAQEYLGRLGAGWVNGTNGYEEGKVILSVRRNATDSTAQYAVAHFTKDSFDNLLDNYKNTFGVDKDFSIYYNGSDGIINPKEVGSGKLFVLGDGVFNNLTSNGGVGLTTTKTITNATGECTLIYTGGLLTGGTC